MMGKQMSKFTANQTRKRQNQGQSRPACGEEIHRQKQEEQCKTQEGTKVQSC